MATKNIPTPEAFSALCYLVLLDHHGQGYSEAAPSYIEEKLHLLEMGYEAYGKLDYQNQRKVITHLDLWRYELPQEIQDYELELNKALIEKEPWT